MSRRRFVPRALTRLAGSAQDDVTYAEKLRDPRWQRKRLEIFQRDNFTCLSCGRKDLPLNIHHLVYRRADPWDYPDDLYQTLCDGCHEIRQELTDKASDALRIAISKLPTERMALVAQRIMGSAMDEL